MECNCRTATTSKSGKQPQIIYCPLYKAAWDLLEVAEDALYFIESLGDNTIATSNPKNRLKEIITKAIQEPNILRGGKMIQHFNEHVANLINGNRCRCDDGSCDWCQIYYANDENLALIIESYVEAETQRLKDALHDAEAIGDFPAELRSRVALIDAAKAIGIENAEITAKLAQLRQDKAELLEAVEDLFATMSKECHADVELPLEVALALSALREAADKAAIAKATQ